MTAPAGLGRASALGAIGTLGSRVTGFARTLVVVAVIGTGGFSQAYNYANTTPNIVYDLLLGGVLTSVVVPLLVRAHREDADGGTGFSQALLSTVTVALAAVCVIAVLAAPLIIGIYLPAGTPPADRARAVLFTRFFLPQLLFYALTAVSGAILNTRGRYGRDTAAPILNNVVVIVTAVIFALGRGRGIPTSSGTSTGAVVLLALGTTVGVAAMAVVLVPALASAGVRWRWSFALPRDRVLEGTRLAGWVFLAVLVSQLGFVVVARLAGPTVGYPSYSTAYQLFQLPYALVGVSVISALLPRMSRHAAGGDLPSLRGDLSHGLRLALLLVIPGSLLLAAAARPLCTVIIRGSGAVSAALIGDVLAVFALALVPFTVQQIVSRSFYAQSDSRTPALLTSAVTAVLVVADLVLVAAVPGPHRIVALAGGFAVAYTVGAAVSVRLAVHRVGGRGFRVLRLAVRITLVTVVSVGFAELVAKGVGAVADGHLGLTAAALLRLVVLGAVALPALVAGARRLRIRELEPMLGTVGAMLARLPLNPGKR